jgi:drug/metabolite transporter (DMT)-like permease
MNAYDTHSHFFKSIFYMLIKLSKNEIVLHITVLIWGFTGILGALISISAVNLVWYRVLIASISLLIYFNLKGKNLKISKSQFIQYIATGGLVGLHWLLFFQSIKVSTVSVTLVCLSSLTLFTSILEPIIKKERIAPIDIITGIIIIIGIGLIFTFESDYALGIILGLSCAIIASLFSIINSNLVKTNSATTISFYEMVGAFLWVSVYILLFEPISEGFILDKSDFLYLMLLGTICTAAAYVAGVAVMKELSAFKVALVTNLEPVYGIILAWLFFGQKEKMSWGFYLGSIIILGTIFLYPYFKKSIAKRRYIRRKTLN